MITEDYVSDETFKLLKEKGFDDSCCRFVIESDKTYYRGAPTLQMVMKWLREIHDVYVDISIYVITKDILKYNINVYYKKHKNDSMYLGIHLTKECSKYEEACEAACIYALKNLI